MPTIDDATLKETVQKGLSSQWISAKELQDRVGNNVRIFRIKTIARQLEKEGVLELSMRATKYGYPDEHYRLKGASERVRPGKLTPIQEILKGLNKFPGIYGSLLVTEDGIVVASAIGEQLDEEAVAALSSHMIHSIGKGLDSIGFEKFKRFALRASHGRMIFVDLEIAYLVVVARPDLKLEQLTLEIESVSHRIKTRRAR